MKKTKRITAFIAAIICISMLGGCGNKAANSETAENTEGTVVTTVVSVDENAVDPSVPFDLEGGVTDKMYNRALLNEGNTSRLAAAMEKAKKGESITVAAIGGSITQGTAASGAENCYASRFFAWWQEKFPECEVNPVNAGIGGTDSYLGVHRLDEQVLSHSPDVVVIEFSVNDTDKTMNKYSYDSLVRKVLSAENKPAVILLFTTQEDGTSLQDVHKEIGAAYDLPMISYRQAVYPEVEAGTINWKDISPDNIHPNNVGHGIIGQLLSRYLDGVYSSDTAALAAEVTAFDAEGYTNDYYKNAKLVNASQMEYTADGFEVGQNKLYTQFPENWITEGGGTLSFETECQNLGILYLKTTDGKSGTYEVYVDGERKGKLEGDFSGGWGSHAAPKQILLAKDTAKHTVEIKPAEGSEDKGITILAIMES
ncbi:MAG: SGNH/GDSL hydrolase family protein [Oscillospiraceae bacterium]